MEHLAGAEAGASFPRPELVVLRRQHRCRTLGRGVGLVQPFAAADARAQVRRLEPSSGPARAASSVAAGGTFEVLGPYPAVLPPVGEMVALVEASSAWGTLYAAKH